MAYDPSGALITAETHSPRRSAGRSLEARRSLSALWTGRSSIQAGRPLERPLRSTSEGNIALTGVFELRRLRRRPPSRGNEHLRREVRPGEATGCGDASFSVTTPFRRGSPLTRRAMSSSSAPSLNNIDFGEGPITACGRGRVHRQGLIDGRGSSSPTRTTGNGYLDFREVAVLSGRFLRDRGRFNGEPDLGLGPIQGSNAILVSRFSAEGVITWAKAIESTSGEATAYDVAIDPSDNIVLAGSLSEDPASSDALHGKGIDDAFVIALRPNGDFRLGSAAGWPRRTGRAGGSDRWRRQRLVGGGFSELDRLRRGTRGRGGS